MRSNTCNSLLIPACVVALLLCCPTLQAIQTITIGNTYAYTPPAGGGTSPNVGPYSATISPSPGNLLVFCLDGNINGANGNGTLYAFNDPIFQARTGQASLDTQEEEAAFLASYALTLDPSHNQISTVDGPIQLAIWYIMNTLPSSVTAVNSTTNPVAWAYVRQAQNFVGSHPSLFSTTATTGFMSGVSVWIPSAGTQRFIDVGPLPPGFVDRKSVV